VAAILSAILVLAGFAHQAPGTHRAARVGELFPVSLLGVSVYPAIVQKFVVAPTSCSKETPQLRRHIDARAAPGASIACWVRDLSGEARLTERDIQANRPTIDNVRLWDRDPLLQTFGATPGDPHLLRLRVGGRRPLRRRRPLPPGDAVAGAS